MLARWDGRMDRDAPEPLVFTAWLRELNRILLATKLGQDYANAASLRPNVTMEAPAAIATRNEPVYW